MLYGLNNVATINSQRKETIITKQKNQLKSAIDIYLKKNKLNILLVSRLMGKSPQFIRVGLRDGILPIGNAIKSGKWNYYVSPKLFEDYTGINVEDSVKKILNEEN